MVKAVGKLKVLVVDDSRLYRNILQRVLADQPGIEVVGFAWNGIQAMERIRQNPPDLVTLDVEMPELDGIETLRQIQEFNKDRSPDKRVGVIMVSILTIKGAQTTIKALEGGAFDFITKPEGVVEPAAGIAALKFELLGKIQQFAKARFLTLPNGDKGVGGNARLAVKSLYPPAMKEVKAVLIGTSTGGPKALSLLLPELARRITVPIIVALHIPPTFSRYLADSLQNRCRPYRILEASHGDMIQTQTIYLSPGHIHLLIDADPQGRPFLQLSDLPPEDGCSPSVNKFFRSAATVYGGNALAIVLTGMSCDGTSGLRSLKEAGAFAIAQDEATSVVWGMPGSAVIAGLVDQVHSLDQIAAAVENRIRMVAPSGPVRKAP